MISTPKTGLGSAHSVLAYHADAFDISKTREGAAHEQTAATWGGRGAEIAGFGVGSPVSRNDFKEALEGRIAGQELPRGWVELSDADQKARAADPTLAEGRVFSSDGAREAIHKTGIDFTFSPGKSVSVTALVGGDTRIAAAHSAAVESAMHYLDGNAARTRISHDGEKRQVATDNLLYAKFEHHTSRDQDPQLHTHVVILNATHDNAAGTWRALDSQELFKQRVAADKIYGAALEANLHKLGYTTEPGRSGPEIVGYTREQLAAFSGRTQGENGMAAYLAAHGSSLETASPGQRQVANFATREDKISVPRAELEAAWAAKALAVGIDPARHITLKPEPAPVRVVAVADAKVEAAVSRVIDHMSTAKATVASLTAGYIAARQSGDQASITAVRGELTAARLALAAQSVAAIGREVRAQDGMQFASADQVAAVLDNAVVSGRLQAQDGKFSVESTAETQNRLAMDSAADRGYRQQEVNAALDRVIERMEQSRSRVEQLTADTQAALAANDPALAKSLGTALRDISRQLAQTEGQLGFAVRSEFKFAGKENVDVAIRQAVMAGRLEPRERTTAAGEKQMTFSVESKTQHDTRQDVTRAAYKLEQNAKSHPEMTERANAALDRLIEKMQTAQHDVSVLTEELKFAQSVGNDRRAKAFSEQLQGARRDLAGLSEIQINRAIRAEVAPRGAQLKAAKPGQGQDRNERELGSAREDKLAAYAEKLADAGAKPEQARNVEQNAAKAGVEPAADKSSHISNEVIKDVIAAAIADGRLHQNVGKLAIETEQQTSSRLTGDRVEHQAHRQAAYTRDRAVQQHSRTTVQDTRAAATKDKIVAQRAEYLKTLNPKQRQAAERSTFSKIARTARNVSFAVRHPGRAAARATVGLLTATIKATLTVAEAGVHAAVAGLATGATALVSRDRAAISVQADSMGVQKKLDVTKLSTMGYRATGAGDVERAKLNVSNAVLMIATKVLEASQLTRTSAGQAMRNELVRNISTTRVSAPEALLAKGMMAVSKAISNRVSAGAKATMGAVQGMRADHKLEQRTEAFKGYLKAESAYLAGKIPADEFRAVHAKASHALNAAKLDNTRAFAKIEQSIHTNLRQDSIRAQARDMHNAARLAGPSMLDKALSLLDSRQPTQRAAAVPNPAADRAERARTEARAQQQHAKLDQARTKATAHDAMLDRVLPGTERLAKVIELTSELRQAHQASREAAQLQKVDLAPKEAVEAARQKVVAIKGDLEKLRPEREDVSARAKYLDLANVRELKIVERELAPAPAQDKAVDRLLDAKAPTRDADKSTEVTTVAAKFHNPKEIPMNMNNDRLIAPNAREREQQGAAADSLIKKDRAREASQGRGDTLDELKARKAAEHGAEAKPERSKERSAGMGW